MNSNVEKVVKRGEDLSSIQSKTDDLQQNALAFKKTTTKIQNEMWWKNKKMQLIIAALVGLAITVAVVAAVRK